MTQSSIVNTTTKDAFEQSVYAQFPVSQHSHVEHELFYSRVDLEEGAITMQEFKESVLKHALWMEQAADEEEANKAIFEGVMDLIKQGRFSKSFVDDLLHEIEQGERSMLARLISFQPVKNSLDAAVSFLAWKHMKAVVELENTFDVDLESLRSEKDPSLFLASESILSMRNFSVIAK
jgi:hypothetical protein